MNDYSKPFRFETVEESKERQAKQLPIDAFNAVTEECFYGVAMRMALAEDPTACEVFKRIAARTREIRTKAAETAEKLTKREAPGGT